jgi:hypothetical protein
MSELAKLLLKSAGTSFPTFDCFKARRVFLADSVTCQSIRIDVYCAYQGRVGLRYKHTFCYDLEQQETMIFDSEEEKSGCKQMCDIINGKLSEFLFERLNGRSLDLETLTQADIEMQ